MSTITGQFVKMITVAYLVLLLVIVSGRCTNSICLVVANV